MRSIPLVLVLLAACGSDPAEHDWGADSGPGNCPAEGTQIDGAYSFGTASAATYEVSGHIVGVAGFNIEGTASYKLGAHDGLSRSLDAIQTYDAATTPISLLVGPKDADCSTAGQCEGFIGRAGTFEVTSLAPYRAQFQLSDLVAYDGSNSAGGAAIAGTVTGCLHSAD